MKYLKFILLIFFFSLIGCDETVSKNKVNELNSLPKCNEIDSQYLWDLIKEDYIKQSPESKQVFEEDFKFLKVISFKQLGEKEELGYKKIYCYAGVVSTYKNIRELDPVDTRYYLYYDNNHQIKVDLVFYQL